MAFLSSLNISGSALTAERFRMDVALQNLANLNTTETEAGGPYRRKQVVFEERAMTFRNALDEQRASLTGGGVRVKQIVENPNEMNPVYDPTDPRADENGYVTYPNVDRTEEMIDLMGATRAYEANLTALNIVKALTMKALEIGK